MYHTNMHMLYEYIIYIYMSDLYIGTIQGVRFPFGRGHWPDCVWKLGPLPGLSGANV